MTDKLYGPVSNCRTGKVLIAAQLSGFPLEFVETPFQNAATKEFLLKNPFGKVPVLETAQGHIYESNAILRYIARAVPKSELYGSSVYEQSLVDQWIEFTTNEVECNTIVILVQVLGFVPANEDTYKAAYISVLEKFQLLENHLKKQAYLVGAKITIADIALAAMIQVLLQQAIDEKQRKNYPTLMKWFTAITEMAAWRDNLGRPRLCKAAFPLPKAAPAAKKEVEKKDQPKKEQPAKKEQPVKQEVAAKPVQEEEEAEPKKKQNPLDLLPKSTFDIDNFKRQFFIDKDIKKSITDLLNNFDNEGWSLWEITYNKAPGEGKQILFTRNLFKGFLQRFDPNFRKYSFAIHGMYGDEPNLELKGAWLWRGTALPQEILDHPQYDVHTFKKIDLNNAQQKQLWTDYWVNQTEDESKVDGLTLRECIYFR